MSGLPSHKTDSAAQERRLSVLGFLVVVVGFLAVLLVVGTISGHGLDLKHGDSPNTKTVLLAELLPECFVLAYVVSVITRLGWWRPVIRERPSVPRLPQWVWVIPFALLATALVVIDYGKLGRFGAVFWVALALYALLVGTAEELMFRGIGVEVFRRRGFPEPRVALWTSVIFGAAHASNLLVSLITGADASPIQALITAVVGYFFYLSRRVSGTILVPIVVHATWDFALFSQGAGHSPKAHSIVLVTVFTLVVLAIATAVRKPVRAAHPPPQAVAPAESS